jgi:hypothetical protein
VVGMGLKLRPLTSDPKVLRCRMWRRHSVCRAETLLGPLAPRPCARPSIIRRTVNQSRLHWVFFDISNDSLPLALVPHPVVVGLGLPGRFSCAAEDQIRLPDRGSLERLQQSRWRDLRQQQHVNVIGEDGKRPQLIVPNRTPRRKEATTARATRSCARYLGPVGVESRYRSSQTKAAPEETLWGGGYLAWGRLPCRCQVTKSHFRAGY